MSEPDSGGRVRTDMSNVLVIGSGAAGLRAAIAAHEAGTEVVIVGKRPKKDAHTVVFMEKLELLWETVVKRI